MKKISIGLFVWCGLVIFSPITNVQAAIVNVGESGQVKVNVLSATDSLALTIPKRQDLEIKDIALDVEESKPSISLTKFGETIQLNVQTENGQKNMDVTNFEGDVVEIEERPQSEKVKIYIKDKKFVLDQSGVKTFTAFPLSIDPVNAELSVKTETGTKYLALLPKDATDILLRAKILTSIPSEPSINLVEENGIVVYEIKGIKTLNLFNVADYNFDIVSKVSAANGEVTFTNEPIWLKVVTLFLT